MYTLLEEDLTDIYKRLGSFWPTEQTFLITGGTGFFGRWIVESISRLEKKLQTQNKFYILSRQSSNDIIDKIPVLSEPYFQIIQGDIEDQIHLNIHFDYIIHAAKDVTKINKNQMLSSNSNAIKNIISAVDQKRLKKFLYVSSGAVYNQKNDRPCLETDLIGADILNSYSQEKMNNENEIIQAMGKNKYAIARCFSFLGPFANPDMVVMHMLNKKIKNETFNLSSPHAKRSYMYPTDLVVQLFYLLLKDTKHNIYNIGSNHSISLQKLADQFNINTVRSENNSPSLAGLYYYPNTDRINSEFQNLFTTNLETAIQKTFKFQTERLKI